MYVIIVPITPHDVNTWGVDTMDDECYNIHCSLWRVGEWLANRLESGRR